jgi:hypothetical protein
MKSALIGIAVLLVAIVTLAYFQGWFSRFRCLSQRRVFRGHAAAPVWLEAVQPGAGQ